jgi:hypothetical protein
MARTSRADGLPDHSNNPPSCHYVTELRNFPLIRRTPTEVEVEVDLNSPKTYPFMHFQGLPTSVPDHRGAGGQRPP